MDNGAFTCNNKLEIQKSYELIKDIFMEYKFELQQFATNCKKLQNSIDLEENSNTSSEVKLLGMIWDRKSDTLSPHPLNLDQKANTKRKILRTINEIYDVYNLYGPLILRSKLFLQRLALDKTLDWDSTLNKNLPSD